MKVGKKKFGLVSPFFEWIYWVRLIRDGVVPVFREGKEWLAEHSRVSFGDKLSRMAKFYNLRTCELESLPFTASGSRIPQNLKGTVKFY